MDLAKTVFFLFMLGAIVGVIAMLVTGRLKKGRAQLAAVVVVGILILANFLLNSVGQVAAGHRGVVLSFGAVSGKILGEGIYFVTPVAESVVEVSIQTRAYEANAAAASKDLQDVDTAITLNYRLDPLAVNKVYQTLGLEYEPRVIKPAIQESVKAITASYNAEDLIHERGTVKAELERDLGNRLGGYGIIIEAVNITNFEFSQAFNEAVEAKMVANQKALEAENRLKQIEVEARQAEAQAKGRANAAIAEAEGEARSLTIITEAQVSANNRLRDTITDALNQYRLIDKLGADVRVIVIPAGSSFVLGSDLIGTPSGTVTK